MLRIGISKRGAFAIADSGGMGDQKHMAAAVFGVAGAGRGIVRKKATAVEIGDGRCGFGVGAAGGIDGALYICRLIPVVGPVVSFAGAIVSGLIKGVVQVVADFTADSVVVLAAHFGAVDRIGASIEPALRKMAAHTDVDGIGRAQHMNGILSRHRQPGPEKRIT